jgi:hypothetical protein
MEILFTAWGGLKNDNEKIKGISVNHRESIRLSAEGLRVTKTPSLWLSPTGGERTNRGVCRQAQFLE